jgi:hypothetical protein
MPQPSPADSGKPSSASYHFAPGKRFGVANAVLWEAIKRSQSQQKRLSSIIEAPLISSECSTSMDFDLEAPSRTSSQSRAIRTFARELERYATNTNAAGRLAESTPTATASKISVDTIVELLPYQSEFHAAGLAVTSAEQKGFSKSLNRLRPGQHASVAQGRAVGMSIDGYAASPSYYSTDSKPSGNSNCVHAGGPTDQLRYILADELPSSKAKKTGRRHFLHWLHRRPPPEERPPEPPPSSTKPGYHKRLSKAPMPRPPNGFPGECGQSTWRSRSCLLILFAVPPSTPSNKTTSFSWVDRPLPPPPQPEDIPPPAPSEMVAQQSESSTPEWAHVYDFLFATSSVDLTPEPAEQRAQAPRSSAHRGPGKRQRDYRLGPVHETIQEVSEPDPTPEKKKPSPSRLQHVKAGQTQPLSPTVARPIARVAAESVQSSSESLPQLPFTWKYAVSTPSSLEKALDEVVGKLAEMGNEEPERSEQTVKEKKQARTGRSTRATRMPTAREKLRLAVKMRQRRLAGESSSMSAPSLEKAKSLSAQDETVDHEDRDISDQDVLKGLRMAISAACDQDLDVWLRGKTGLRLRRFLADLKTFKNLGEEDWLPEEGAGAHPSDAQQMRNDSQRYRRLREENRKLEANIEAARKQKKMIG